MARDLVQGLSLPEIGAKLQVLHNTVRNQMQSLLVKSSAKRQAEFVVLVHRLAARVDGAGSAG